MTHLSVRVAAVAAASCLALACAADGAHAQCATCATPTVAYAPVVAAPAPVVVAPRLGLFDRWRLRRWGLTQPVVAAPAASYAVGYAPAYAAAYAPSYTAAYAPAYTAGYTPYMSAYAPLQPTTVYRPAVLTPVVEQPACTTCAYAPAPCDACATSVAYPAAPCDACSACATSTVEQAGYVAPSSGCSSCGVAEPYYGTPAEAGEPQTPAPALDGSGYVPQSDGAAGTIDPLPLDENDPAALSAPPLMTPPFNGDNTASKPTVDIHTALYRREAKTSTVSATTRPSVQPSRRRAAATGGWTTSAATR